ncbi:MAG: RtcB family protein [Planctomycetes bacterium]|nr:RtcB family protein [Planctomycetota bacterium]
MITVNRINDNLWEIPPEGRMNVPGRVYASAKLMEKIKEDKSLEQVVNVACLPGIIKYSLAMPDIHWGYGFPIGGVAAFDMEKGIISPGGVGYDINCGVRLMRTNLTVDDVQSKIKEIVRDLYNAIPSGVGSEGAIPKLSPQDEKQLLIKGSRWAVEKGYGEAEDLEHTEDEGRIEFAEPSIVSSDAIKRGLVQVGTLGSGNHFLEIARVEEVYRPDIAKILGLDLSQIVIAIHSGSRGFGYQICDDYVKKLLKAAQKYGISLPDRQLACAPLKSEEGREYLSAMACAANYAWVNRQVIMALAEEALLKSLSISPRELGMELIYDVAHNIAKIEKHEIDGKKQEVCVHRKGATRAFPPGHLSVPEVYRSVGQPVLVPGDMGRSSYLCVGTEEAMKQTFGSACHGAGRVASRSQMIKQMKNHDLFKELESLGVFVMSKSRGGLAEEMPQAYKNVTDVVRVMDETGISKKVAKFKPLGVIKG